MEIRKFGNIEIWKYGNMDIWKYGNIYFNSRHFKRFLGIFRDFKKF